MDIRAILAQAPLLSRLTPEALDAFAACAKPMELRSGEVLFREGMPADAAYVVATGRMRAVLSNGVAAGDIGRFEPIGEIGALSDEVRNASVHAVRDSIVLRIGRDDLLRLVTAYPVALIEMTRVLIARLRKNQRAIALETARSARSFAVIAAAGDVDAHTFAEALSQALGAHDKTQLVDDVFVDARLGAGAALQPFEDGDANARLMTLLNTVEDEYRYLVYAGGGDANAWSWRCMRQADRVIVLAHSGALPMITPMLDMLRNSGIRTPVDLVLLRPESAPAGDVLAWREHAGAGTHYFVRPEHAADMAGVTRNITGRGIGLVLGGGGARGFAHIGLLRALHELRIPVDIYGGSSMGAFCAALAASGYDHNEMTHIASETFVRHNYLNDYMLPMVALIRGRKFVQRLHEIFEERQIEQLRTPYFCISTNLTRGVAMTHDRGPLYMWLACSMCVPGVAPPVAYKGELLVDGSVINSLPTDIMHGLRRGPIIASDVSTEGDLRAPGIEGPDPEGLLRWTSPGKRPGLFNILFRTATLTSESGVANRAASADLYIRMPVTNIGLFDWKRLNEASESGYRCAMERLEPVKASLLK
ncbi:MAG: patatin-like phospholipase family protein [Stenotrophobium sp.]